MTGASRVGRFSACARGASLSVAALAVFLFAPPAGADGALEPIRLVYEAAANCPAEGAFEAEVRRSAPGFRVTAADDHARLFVIRLAAEGRAHGRLMITSEGGVTGARDVDGATCAEVASVLAFAVALAVDPAATPPDEGPPVPLPLDGAAPASPARAPAVRAAPRSAGGASLTETWWGVSVHGLVASELAPKLSFGGGASADLGARIGPILPTIRLGLEYAMSSSVSVDSASVSFAEVLTSVEGCPTALRLGPLTLRPCFRVGGGVRILTSTGIPNGGSTYRPWMDLGPTAHLRLRLVRGAFVDLAGAALWNAVQDHAYLAGSSTSYTVHDVQPFSGRGEVAVGVEFR